MADIIWDSELGPAWPSDWSHTTVHAQFVAVTGDGADTDRLPDIAPSGNGEVIFTPSLRTVRYVGADGPYVVSLKQYRAVVDSEGYLCTPDTFGQPGERGIVLPSTDAQVIEPRGEDDNAFTWRVDFNIPSVNIRSDHIAVPVGGPYNLVDLLSPERAAGVVHVIDRVSARDAIQAAQEATAARDIVLPARDQTLAARDETLQHGITTQNGAAYIDGKMAAYETGLRNIIGLVDQEWTSFGSAKLMRDGNQVSVWLVNFSKGTALSGTHLLLTLPSGFRPPETTWVKTYRNSDARVLTSGAIQIINPGASNDSAYFTFPTLNPVPETKPGTPA